MNSITFDGRLAADAELRYTPSGEPVLSFRVASDIGFGERKSTNWFSCQVWGKRGESLKNYLAKGQQVTVYGQLTLREWQDKDGNKRVSPDVRVNELSLQGGRSEMGASSGGGMGGGMDDGYGYSAPAPRQEAPAAPRRQEPKAAPRMDDMDDDIPF
ncbi:single-stranded DNA-binding protein [Chromobacterium vaccinii]|uniref:Single-stranded DNA-binding protein n=5 Tax=Chromobacteriaceae TaxID=1499392 RepID=A0A344UNA6_9NEIS|nr:MULTISPECIES: single-stranded DNA-binding protein [Chromobacteriaceae]AVG16860.1 single-stranded DNA-binding protein [Chromobacterium vaccinii]AXE31371.1 single-stranded DNA-binding protein [Chromobacterium phragmitis]AXE36754.1 single-stranded DNA-binding protein [Chromobacterium phragmitis]ERE17761.1 single-stranded DNA-binding protein [Pseudogulbenkiania ferrooxidans EGD-HP2]MBX9298729.1 single-stranded DNA-binding protein [Chromobacterium vaccinii]